VKPSFFDYVKFVVATALAGVMLYIHAYVKDLPSVLLMAPYLLMPIDISKLAAFFGRDKK
jgi:hypothetical protein